PLLGVVPESQDILVSSNVGAPVTVSKPKSVAASAYSEAARRLMGEDVQVTIPTERRGLLEWLFKRKAI
ncbi:MAG: septum site-determining protein MinD, partial [Acetobacter sp.]|nr:septum site-determining protein MinD [Acetobacter sp.]